ncbi:MAG TPA: ribose-phosphate pyrophosphokinase [Chloroflexota bacterium]|nr:ribose-phosphate pyrophosphokinase [Chloroflexota bacterium]
MPRVLGSLQIFSGNANPELARAVAGHTGTPLGSADVFQFSNENVFVRINETVRENDVFVIQTFSSPVNTSIMELLIMIDALKRASAGRITAVIPYFAYGRTDKKDQPRVPITARLLANMIERAGAQRILTIDLHAGQIEGFFDIPVDHLTAFPLLSRYIAEQGLQDLVVVAPDLGTAKKARNFAESLGVPLALLEKRRPLSGQGNEVLNVIGDVRHRRAILVDDEIDTGGSMLAAARILEAEGVTEIFACAVHGVLSGPAIQRIETGPFAQVVITDTIPLPEHKRSPTLRVIPIGELLSEAIQRIHSGGSVGAMFRP